MNEQAFVLWSSNRMYIQYCIVYACNMYFVLERMIMIMNMIMNACEIYVRWYLIVTNFMNMYSKNPINVQRILPILLLFYKIYLMHLGATVNGLIKVRGMNHEPRKNDNTFWRAAMATATAEVFRWTGGVAACCHKRIDWYSRRSYLYAH